MEEVSGFNYSISMSSTNYVLFIPNHKYDPAYPTVYMNCFEDGDKTVTGITGLHSTGANSGWQASSAYAKEFNYLVIGY